MKHLPITLFLLLAVSVANANDIATIQSYLDDNKTDDAQVLHGVHMACLNLTRTGTAEAVPVLKQLLDDERFSTVARTALINIPGGLKREPAVQLELPQDAALLASILTGRFKLEDVFDDPILVSKNFNVILRVVLELKSEDTGTLVLDNINNLEAWQEAAIIRNLGARKDSVAIVPRLMELAQSEHAEIRSAAVQALGEIGDIRAVDTLLHLAGTPAAIESLKLFQGDEFNKKIVALLDSDNKQQRLAALDIIGERQIVDARDGVWKLLLLVQDVEIRIAAFGAFARCAEPAAHNIVALIIREGDTEAFEGTEEEKNAVKKAAREAVMALCRRTSEQERAVASFVTLLKTADVQASSFYLDCLFQLGGEKAAECIASVAMGNNDALTDKATQLLGRWTTPEVAPYLIDIAEKHPSERYQSRALRGYLRVIRQMGLPVEQKVQMAEKALAAAKTDVDKEQAKEVLERFKATLKGTSIFDGKTFDGWEFRNNEQWFRIVDGAIVCGSLEEPIPRTEFLASKKEYGDFTLYIECKAIGRGANGGVQFRSVRTPADAGNSNEMIGYQADMTDTAQYWGAIYDESRRNRFVAEPPKELIERIFRPNDWNQYVIVCKGNNVKLYLNGELTVDYTETDANIPARGFFGLQVHGGPPSEIWYRNIRVEE
jgi:HEAT repeat protein